MKKLMRCEGAALVTVIIVMLLLFTLGTAILALVSTERKISVNQLQSKRSFYLAEAGVQRVMAELENDYSWSEGQESNNILISEALGEGTITVILDERDEQGNPQRPSEIAFIIVSKGDVSGIKRGIKAWVEVDLDWTNQQDEWSVENWSVNLDKWQQEYVY